MSQNGDPKASMTVLVGLTGAVLLLATVLFTMALFYDAERIQTASKLYDRPYPEVDALRNEQESTLHAYRWISEKDGVVAIPIERAMELVIPDLKSTSQPATMNAVDSGLKTSQPTGKNP